MAIGTSCEVFKLYCSDRITIKYDVPPLTPNFITKRVSTQLGTRGVCKNMTIHIKELSELSELHGGRSSKGKFGSDPVELLQ